MSENYKLEVAEQVTTLEFLGISSFKPSLIRINLTKEKVLDGILSTEINFLFEDVSEFDRVYKMLRQKKVPLISLEAYQITLLGPYKKDDDLVITKLEDFPISFWRGNPKKLQNENLSVH